jgi:hypothetical protein
MLYILVNKLLIWKYGPILSWTSCTYSYTEHKEDVLCGACGYIYVGVETSLKNDSDLEDGIDIDLWDMFVRF